MMMPVVVANAVAHPQTSTLAWLAARTRRLEELLLTDWPADLPIQGPLVSVVLPTRNRARLIGAAIASVQAQSYQSWELLIVDDGGTDETETVVAPALADARISYRRQPAAGVPAARNAALAAARGTLFAYLDSDNTWEPEFLRRMVPCFADEAVGCAYAALVFADAGPEERRILWQEFDRAELAQGNFIDLNVFMHRRDLVAAAGDFDVELERLSDWDLILRYTETAPAKDVPVLGARYRTNNDDRITRTALYHPAYRRIRAKHRRFTKPARPLRVLYVVWQYPQLSEMYIEAELRGLRRLGVHIEVWTEVPACSPYAAPVPVHRGALAEAIAAMQPDLVHCHWLNIAAKYADTIAAAGMTMTVRGHGFDVTAALIDQLCAHPAVAAIYLTKHQLAAYGRTHPRLKQADTAFDVAMFRPAARKNPRLVLRASAALPSKELPMFLHLAKRFPEHRFVLAIVACNLMEAHVGELLALRREIDSPAEILLNLPHEQLATLMAEAGIYLHTALPPAAGGTPLGQPISMAEAMASGCYVLARDFSEFVDYLAEAGDTYADAEQAATLISATTSWTETEWTRRARLSEERGWTHFTGDDTFHTIHEDWARIEQG